jgi:hypothetical protein
VAKVRWEHCTTKGRFDSDPPEPDNTGEWELVAVMEIGAVYPTICFYWKRRRTGKARG